MTVLAYTAIGDGTRSASVYCQTEEDGKTYCFVNSVIFNIDTFSAFCSSSN